MASYEEKYNMLRKAINEYKDVYEDEQGVSSILEVAEMTDKLETEAPAPAPAQEKAAMTKEDIMSVKSATERIKLIRENPNLFNGGK